MDYTKNYYTILGVTSEADAVVIRAAYRALMAKYHPDRNPSSEALQVAKSLTEAILILGDDVRRLDYDLHRLDYIRAQDGGTPQQSTRPANIPVDARALKDAFRPGSAERTRAIVGGGGLLIVLALFVLAMSVA